MSFFQLLTILTMTEVKMEIFTYEVNIDYYMLRV